MKLWNMKQEKSPPQQLCKTIQVGRNIIDPHLEETCVNVCELLDWHRLACASVQSDLCHFKIYISSKIQRLI